MKEVLKTLGKGHRIEVLKILEKEPMGIYDVYKILKTENPGIYTSVIERSLKELWNIGLAYRDEKKRFHITAYGTLILNSVLDLPKPEVIAYLKERWITLPEKFLVDIPSILKKAFIMREVEIIEKFIKIQEEIEKEVLFILEKPFFSQKIMENNLKIFKRGVKVRGILHRDNFKVYLDKDRMEGVVDGEVLKEYSQAFILNQGKYDIETRFLPDIKMKLYVIDRKLVAIGLPGRDGDIPIDSGIVSYDQQAVNWGIKVFDYYWQKSEEPMQ